jgi:peroxiredoxin
MLFLDILVSIVALSALSTGMAAPDFEAFSYDGRKITLSAVRQQGPVMLVFIRGFG